MLNRRPWHLLALICVAACSKGRSEASPSAASAASRTPAASGPAAVASAATPSPPPPVPTDVPAKVKVDADGITLIETTTGSIVVKTTTLWNAPLEVTYESCEYYLRAIPVMERQVDPKRGAHFKEVCKGAKVSEAKSPAPKAPVAKVPTKPATSAQ
jgi:hypothetical protein